MTRTPPITFAGLTDQGRVRQDNEDRWFADDAAGIFLVSDGMGGTLGGAIASEIVVEILPAMLKKHVTHRNPRDSNIRQQAIDTVAALSGLVYAEVRGQPGLEGMGATLVLALVHDGQSLILHLGDSPAYLLHQDSLRQLTHDHTVAQALVNHGQLARKDAGTHPAAHRLTRYVGMPGQARPDAEIVALHGGDRLLLCTDGLSGLVAAETLRNILSTEKDASLACHRLIDTANDAGGFDNITALIIEVN